MKISKGTRWINKDTNIAAVVSKAGRREVKLENGGRWTRSWFLEKHIPFSARHIAEGFYTTLGEVK